MSEFKLKGLTSIDVKDGEIKECEVEGIEKGKVVLVKTNGKVTALNANCTHYGAPLAKGVVTPNGRIVCPWHGACFKVSTGDVEDAPAPDALNTFTVSEKNGGVYIKGEEADIKSGRRKPNVKCSAKGQEQVVIVGGGSGAFGVYQTLRNNGYSSPITVISNEGNLPLDRTKLSKALIADASKLQWRDEAWFKEADISFAHDTVTGIDFSKRSVTTKSGSSHSYTKLVLATGGTPKRLPMDGLKGDLSNVFVLRQVSDVQQILSSVGEDKKKNIVVIGSSFIGMEVANALAKENTVTVIGMEAKPLERIMGKEVGAIFQKTLEKNGVKFYMEASVEGAKPSSKDSKSVGSVQLKDGTNLDADLVILGVGVGPATEYLKDNKEIELNKDGSINTDESFAVKGLKDVFAIGDIASYPYHGPDGNGKPVRIEHWNVANNAGASVAKSIIDPSSKPKEFIPVFWSALGSQLRYCGHTPNGFDDLILKGEPDEGKFEAYYAKGDTIVAVASMMKDPVMTKSAELMLYGKMPTASEIRNGTNVLEVAF